MVASRTIAALFLVAAAIFVCVVPQGNDKDSSVAKSLDPPALRDGDGAAKQTPPSSAGNQPKPEAGTAPVPAEPLPGPYAAIAAKPWKPSDAQIPNPDEHPVQLPPADKTQPIPDLHPGAKGVSIMYGILTSPSLLHTRLLPLLSTSLKNEEAYAFYLRNDTDPTLKECVATIKGYAEATSRPHHPVVLDPKGNILKMSIRNAWADLPVMEFLFAKNTNADFYAIVDDDSYILSRATRHILAEYAGNATLMSEPLYLGDVLTWGKGGGWRIVRRPGGKKELKQSTKRNPVTFVVGGGGIFLNSAAVRKIMPNISVCKENHLHPAGDIRMGACAKDAGVGTTVRREFVRDTVFRSVGELALYKNRTRRLFPASFHRLRQASWYHAMHAVEEAKQPDQLVKWEDLQAHFTVRPPYYDFLFSPKRSANYTTVYGIRVKTKLEIAREKMIKERFDKDVTRGNPQADEWGDD